MIEGLAATAPDLKLRSKLMLFGQFIGNWDIVEARYPQPDRSEIKKRGSIHFGWILDGLAIQDVWMTYEEKVRRFVPAGTTIRFYDSKIDAWHSIWISPSQNVAQTFIGRKIKDEIVLESYTKEGHPEKWIFSNITPQSFHWHSIESHDNGTTWKLTEEMEVRRSRETRI